jgi:hypothetical protein
MRRVVSVLGGLVAGVLVAGTGIVGSTLARSDRDPASEPLALADYCRDRYGELAASYEPRRIDRWSCSVWANGVWRLEVVDLNAACRWQRGPAARLGGVDASQREVACTR